MREKKGTPKRNGRDRGGERRKPERTRKTRKIETKSHVCRRKLLLKYTNNCSNNKNGIKTSLLAELLDKASTAYSVEVSAEKTKLMTNNTSGIKIKVNGQKLETVTIFRYLGSAVSDEGSKPEIPSWIA